MMNFQALDIIINNLSSDDPSIVELKRIVSKEPPIQEKGLRAWLVQYQREASVKVFLAPLAAYIALQLAHNSIQDAMELICPGLNLPHSAMGTPLFIKSMPHRFTKAGFTGSPLKEQNHLYAQLAWLFVDWNKSDYQEQYWKILYPELVYVYDGNDNTIWPQYGQGILVKNSKGEYQNRLINYAEVYKLAQTAEGFEKLQKEFSAETLRRVYRFYPGHKEFWVNMQNKELPESPYKNYFEFFTALQKFLYDNRYTGVADPVTKEIATDIEVTPTAQATFWSHYAPFLHGFINHINAQTDAYKKTLDLTTQDQGTRLLGVVDSLLYPPQTGFASCFDLNQILLLRILSSTDRKTILEGILISPKINVEKSLSESGIDHLPSILGQLKAPQDKKELLNLINEPMGEHDIQLGVDYWVTEYKRILKDKAYHIVRLHDLLYEIQNKEESLDFLKTILGDPLDLSLLLADSAVQFKDYADKIIGHYPLLYQTQSVNDQSVKLGLKKGFAKKHISMPVGFVLSCANNKALIQSAMSNDWSGEISDKFAEYVDADESLSWVEYGFFQLGRMLDLETAKYFIKYFLEDLTNDFFHDLNFFCFVRSFYVAGENIWVSKSPSQDALFEIIVLPSLSLYCKTAANFRNLIYQMNPYSNIILSNLMSKIPSLLNSIEDLESLAQLWPAKKIDQLYDILKEKMPAVINNSTDLETVEKLFGQKAVKSDFALALIKQNASINFRFFIWLYIKSPENQRGAVMEILKNTPNTGPPRFVMSHDDISPAIHEFSNFTKDIKKENLESLILYYQKAISNLLSKAPYFDVLDFMSLISDSAWPTFYKFFKEDIESFSQKCNASLNFKMLTYCNYLNKNIKRLDAIFNGFIPKILALIKDKNDFDSLSKVFPINPDSKTGLAPYLLPLITNALAIYKLLPANSKKDLSVLLPEDFKEFFEEFSSNPALKESWKIALMPNEKQRRNAVCSLFGAAPGTSSTSSIVRFSPTKMKEIVAATTSPSATTSPPL